MYKDKERFKTGDFIRHFRRDINHEGLNYLYVYIGIAQHSETLENLAVYKALYGDCKLYVRPAWMFNEPIDKEKHPEAKQHFRFEKANASDLKAIEQEINI